MSNNYILIGLSGQSCAGKNEAGKILERYGFHVIDADAISRLIFSQHEKIFTPSLLVTQIKKE